MRSRPDPTRHPQRSEPPEQQRGAQPSEAPTPAGELAVPLEHGRARIARLEDALALLEDYDAVRAEDRA
jgi:hypothetical protein